MSQANQTGMGSRSPELAAAGLPSFEMPSVEELTDPDITPTRWDIDARALDRALGGPPSSEEIELEDILEVARVDSPSTRTSSGPVSSLPPLPPPRSHVPPAPRVMLASIDVVLEEADSEPASVATSFAPVTVEEPSPWLAESTFGARPPPDSGRRRGTLAWAIGLGLLAGVVVVGLVLRSGSGKVVAQGPPPSSPEKPTVAVTSLQQPSSPPSGGLGSTAPTFDVASLPQAPVGTVSLAASASAHRLIVDGVVAPSGSVVVKCGKHLVKVGSKGRRQVVDVTSGGETIVGL